MGAIPYVEEALRWLPDEGRHEPHAGRIGADYARHLPIRRGGAHPPGMNDRPRILVADDNRTPRQYVSRLLSERYEVTAVADGMAALAAARSRPPDLVLSDVMMPLVNGFRVLRELRDDPSTASIPVILLSARAGEESHVEGLEAGADDYLVKPFSARELLARVSAHLELARVRRLAATRERELLAEAEDILESITDGFLPPSTATGGSPTSTPRPSASTASGARRCSAASIGNSSRPTWAPGTRRNSVVRSLSASASSSRAIMSHGAAGSRSRPTRRRTAGSPSDFRDITERKHGLIMERLLAEASATVASSLDYKTNLKRVAELVVPTLADICVFDVVGRDGALQRVGWAHIPLGEASRFETIDRFVPGSLLRQSPDRPRTRWGRPS